MTVEVDPQAKARQAALPTPPSVPEPVDGAGGHPVGLPHRRRRHRHRHRQPVLATAALRAGYAVELLDQIGLAQKAGPVVGTCASPRTARSTLERVTPGHADAILAFDLLTAADSGNLRYGSPAHARGGLDLH